MYKSCIQLFLYEEYIYISILNTTYTYNCISIQNRSWIRPRDYEFVWEFIANTNLLLLLVLLINCYDPIQERL